MNKLVITAAFALCAGAGQADDARSPDEAHGWYLECVGNGTRAAEAERVAGGQIEHYCEMLARLWQAGIDPAILTNILRYAQGGRRPQGGTARASPGGAGTATVSTVGAGTASACGTARNRSGRTAATDGIATTARDAVQSTDARAHERRVQSRLCRTAAVCVDAWGTGLHA